MTALAPTMQSFFTEYLIGQRGASSHTITAYRDTFRILLNHLHQRTGIKPHRLDIGDLHSDAIADFLTMLEKPNGTTAPAPATPGWPPSTRCSTTPPSATPNTPISSPASWPSPPRTPARACSPT